jgi:hypothetical protein
MPLPTLLEFGEPENEHELQQQSKKEESVKKAINSTPASQSVKSIRRRQSAGVLGSANAAAEKKSVSEARQLEAVKPFRRYDVNWEKEAFLGAAPAAN